MFDGRGLSRASQYSGGTGEVKAGELVVLYLELFSTVSSPLAVALWNTTVDRWLVIEEAGEAALGNLAQEGKTSLL